MYKKTDFPNHTSRGEYWYLGKNNQDDDVDDNDDELDVHYSYRRELRMSNHANHLIMNNIY